MRRTGMRFAAWTGLLYVALSWPFLLGVLAPSPHEASLYASLYVLVNVVPLLIAGPLGVALVERFGSGGFYETGVVIATLVGWFWIAVAFASGALLEWRRRGQVPSREGRVIRFLALISPATALMPIFGVAFNAAAWWANRRHPGGLRTLSRATFAASVAWSSTATAWLLFN